MIEIFSATTAEISPSSNIGEFEVYGFIDIKIDGLEGDQQVTLYMQRADETGFEPKLVDGRPITFNVRRPSDTLFLIGKHRLVKTATDNAIGAAYEKMPN